MQPSRSCWPTVSTPPPLPSFHPASFWGRTHANGSGNGLTGQIKLIKLRWSWTLFVFGSLYGIPPFTRRVATGYSLNPTPKPIGKLL
jgi:hypothetical protein